MLIFAPKINPLRVAFLLPSLAKTAPIIVAANIIKHIKDVCEKVEVFYFKNEIGIDLGVPCHQLDFGTPYSFEEFDVLHTHMYKPDMYVLRHNKQIKCRTVATIHSFIRHDVFNNYSFPKNLLITHSWYNALRKHDVLVCLTETMKQYYATRYPGMSIKVVNNGICPDTYHEALSPEEEKQLVSIKEKYKIIGTSSLLTKLKGLEIIIPFLQQHPNYVWYAPGAGNFVKVLQRYATRAGVADRCYFPGYKSNISAFYNWFDVFAFPSRNEGFGLSLAEAAYYKRPIVCSNIPVFNELFNSEEVAFFNLDDANSFSEAVEKLEQKPEYYGKNAEAKMLKNYTAPIMAEAYLKIYQELAHE